MNSFYGYLRKAVTLIGIAILFILNFSAKIDNTNMIFIEGGEFMMGDEFGDGDRDEYPLHSVNINGFFIGIYELTQKEWKEIMGYNPSYYEEDHLPVETVTWYLAIAYCNKRSIKEGLKPCYTGEEDIIFCDFNANGYRLPTEAEWEYAAKGGKFWKTDKFKYSGSNDIEAVSWYELNSEYTTHAVGQKQANKLGIYDMSGNVYEWCWDWYFTEYYKTSPNDNPEGHPTSELSGRSLRGGSWSESEKYQRVSRRGWSQPGRAIRGIRIVRSKK